MTIREAGKGIVERGRNTYHIGFTDLSGVESETELDAYNMADLEELWNSLCSEFKCERDSINYVERV